MEEQEDHLMPWRPESDSMVSATVGRAMSTLLGSRPRKLENAICRLSSPPRAASLASLDESLCSLHKHVRDAAQKNEPLDQILFPMIEHSLKVNDSRQSGQAMILLNWLFLDELLSQALATTLVDIILQTADRHIALGWCVLVRGLMKSETTMNQFSGLRENHYPFLKMLFPCISRLSCILHNGRTLQDGFELPTRLSVCAADFTLALTLALTKRAPVSDVSTFKLKLSTTNEINFPFALSSDPTGGNKVKQAVRTSEVSSNLERELLLWDQLEELIILVQRLLAWRRKSRSLYEKGLEKVLKWLEEMKESYGSFQDEAGSEITRTEVLVLFWCWKHYGRLLHLEDKSFPQQYKDLLSHYLSAIQFYTEKYSQEYSNIKDSANETRKFFLNCLCLLLGRLNNQQLERILLEYGLQMTRVLLSQLHCNEEDVIDVVLCIFTTTIFKMNNSFGTTLSETRQKDAVLPLLLPILNERDCASRAVVVLIAEYCSTSAGCKCLQEVMDHLMSGNVLQRRNAIDIISEVIHISFVAVHIPSDSMWQILANVLLDSLGDEELNIREQACNLLPMFDSSLVLPSLIRQAYLSDENVQPSAVDAIIRVLKHHNQKPETVLVFLDFLSNINRSPTITKDTRKGMKLDAEIILKRIPEWSETVQDWRCLIGPLLDKMFLEPSNPAIVSFLSYISEHLADAADIVLHHVLLQMRGQKEIGEMVFSKRGKGCQSDDDSVKLEHSLFDRLCPLLIIRLLPLKVFNDLNSSVIYGQFLKPEMMHGVAIVDHDCLVAVLQSRAFCKFEFEDVRKLATELCGRIHPQVLFPIACSQLEQAVNSSDTLKMKACLFSVCTSLAIRGSDSVPHPVMLKMRTTLVTILSWPSVEGGEVCKAQHGCIDCLALMIYAEIQTPESSGDDVLKSSTFNYVINQLEEDDIEASASIPLRLCMANVLISACQKILESSKKRFARKIVPCLIKNIEVITEPEIRGACIKVLFSAVYNLKSAVLPYASDLLKVSLRSLKEGSEKEKLSGAKLMASLLASDDSVVKRISGGLLQAKSVLSNISSADSSLEIRQVCKRLLVCLTSPCVPLKELS